MLEFKGNDSPVDPDSDLALVRAGYVAVTPLSVITPAPIAGAATAIEDVVRAAG